MITFDIKAKTQPIGTRRGQTVYYAQARTQQTLTNDMVVERVVRETALSEGDVRSALISLSNVFREAIGMGLSVDLAELGHYRVMVPSRRMNSPEEVTVTAALKTPKLIFTPKDALRNAALSVEVRIDRSGD